MSDCIFCKIVAKEIPAKVVYEDEFVLAFKDLSPQAPTHILIIPKIHVENFLDAAKLPGIHDQIFSGISNLVEEQGWNPDGFRVVSNCGRKAGQSVFHLHFHLLGGRELTWPPG